MTDQPDLRPELLERVQAIIEDIAPACVDCSAHVVSNRKSAMERFLRAVAPILIEHGRELEKAEVVAWLRTEAARNFRAAQSSWKEAKETGSTADQSIGDSCFHVNQILARAADQIAHGRELAGPLPHGTMVRKKDGHEFEGHFLCEYTDMKGRVWWMVELSTPGAKGLMFHFRREQMEPFDRSKP